MITRFVAKNYGCLKDVSVALTPLHAFIGPNDSGKSSLLKGLLDVCEQAVGRTDRGFVESRFSSSQDLQVEFRIPGSHKILEYRLGDHQGRPVVEIGVQPDRWTSGPLHGLGNRSLANALGHAHTELLPMLTPVRDSFKGAVFVRFDADQLKTASSLLPEARAHQFLLNRGAGLPGVLDEVLGRGDEAYRELLADVRRLFPNVKTLRLAAISDQAKEVRVELQDGTIVPAHNLSEGLLYYLGYRAAGFVRSVSLLLVEEPETGLHPSRIADVVRVLRAITEAGIQVVMATHSPLVINELNPEEVSVVTRTQTEGTRVTPISDTPNFPSRAKVYALGELWLNYADADTNEAPLLKGGPSVGVVLT